MTSVRLRGVDAGYGDQLVFEAFDLTVASGRMLAVLGASGSGKTTLLRVLAGFLRPTSGTVAIGDQLVSSDRVWLPPERRGVGIVPQEGALFPHLDVARNVAYGLARGSGVQQRIAELLELVGMPGMQRRRPQELSGGQAQRVALARALAPRPRVVLLDEPFSALDAGMRTELGEEVREVLAALQTTAVLVTHDQEGALALADEVAVIQHGRLAQQATPHILYERPLTLAVARFVGDLVELPATRTAGGRVSTAIGAVDLDDPGIGLEAGIVGLRPEQLGLLPGHGEHVVTSTAFHGHDTLVEVALVDGERIRVRVPGRAHVSVGDRLGVSVQGAGRLYPVE